MPRAPFFTALNIPDNERPYGYRTENRCTDCMGRVRLSGPGPASPGPRRCRPPTAGGGNRLRWSRPGSGPLAGGRPKRRASAARRGHIALRCPSRHGCTRHRLVPRLARRHQRLHGRGEHRHLSARGRGTGLVDRIIWLRPPWAEQFKDGRYAFHLGESADGTLKVNQDSDYYAANGAWAPLATLRHTTALIFEVARYDADMARLAPFAGPVVLDIDLDIFSTFNPGAEALRRAGLTQAEIDDIAERFSLENLWLSKNPKKRNEEIRDLKADIASLLTGPWYAGLAALPRLFRLGVGPRDLYKVYAAVEKMPPETPLDTIITNFEYAIGLPEHLSSQAEIDRILEAMDTFLTSGGFRPALVTIARSVEGGYTPPEVCARVEKRLIRILRNALGRIALRYDRMLASEPTL